MTLGARIQRSRINLGLSTIEAAQQLNVSRMTLHRWETNKSFPSYENYQLLKYHNLLND